MIAALLSTASPAELPWHRFNGLAAQWEVLPSFVLGELLFITCAVIALIHAQREGRDHLLIWIAALVAGTANDFIFMALPLVDNFWQAQGTIMLTPRMPLYIPCVYVCFMYYPTVAVRRLRLRPISQAAVTGMVACLFYAPYDIVGAKFLWWTWHDTDLPIAVRILGAPVGSSLWVLTFVAAFAFLIDLALRPRKRDAADAAGPGAAPATPVVGLATFLKGFALVAGLTSICMVLQMTVLQQLDGGTPGYFAFAGGWLVYLGLAIWGWKTRDPEPPRPGDRLLYAAALAYFATLFAIMVSFDPASHRSTGVHQTVGECYVEVTDITGMTRHEFLCASDFDEDFSFECVDELPPDGTEWYTVCGRPHTNYAAWVSGVGLLGIVGIGLFTLFLGPGRKKLVRAR